jgi:hypothetical protein
MYGINYYELLRKLYTEKSWLMFLPIFYWDHEIREFKMGGKRGVREGKEKHVLLVEQPVKQNSGNTKA